MCSFQLGTFNMLLSLNSGVRRYMLCMSSHAIGSTSTHEIEFTCLGSTEVCFLSWAIWAPCAYLITEGIQKPSQERVTWFWSILPPLHFSNNAIQVIKKVMENDEQTCQDKAASPAVNRYYVRTPWTFQLLKVTCTLNYMWMELVNH